jgi:cytochrome c peroxidase
MAGSMLVLGGWTASAPSSQAANAHVANCTTCHTPPDFTDRNFHNNGASQDEYDSVHGTGKFAKLKIPSYEERLRQPDKYLPATVKHPNATGLFRQVPTAENPNAADLGMWNIYVNPDYPRPQAQMQKLLCKPGALCDPKAILPLTIARFRTPPLRDLEDSSPFMHTGRFQTIEDVLHYYMRTSELARRGEIRNGAPELGGITIDEDDLQALAAFLRSLNEDYD